MHKKADLQEAIEQQKSVIAALKQSRKETPHHIDILDLPEDQKFKQLSTQSKHLIDTIKMIAYRAETAMANLLRDTHSQPDQARRLLQALYQSEADLVPDPRQQTLTVYLHHMTNPAADQAVLNLCDELNATETLFPQTNLRLVFKLGSEQNPRDQEF